MSEERFGPYLIEGLLGTGGMGEVHRARDLRKDRVVALKRLHRHLAADRGYQGRFRRESQLAARLQDVHVVPIHDYGEIDGLLYIDMALIRGVDLTRLIADHPRGMPPGRAVHVLSQVAGALDTAHAAGLVHRDVKPSNVLVTDDHGTDFAYLVDFGIARGVGASAGDGGERLTETGSAIGTLTYMAPERFEGRDDPRADVYALACVLFECLTGCPPFPGCQNIATAIYAHCHTPPPRASAVRPGLSPAWDDVLFRGLAKDPTHRYAWAGQLAAAARSVVAVPPPAPTIPSQRTAAPAARPTAVAAVPPPAPTRRPRRRWRAVGAVAAVALLAGGAGVGWSVFRDHRFDGPVTVGAAPEGVAVSPDGRVAAVANTMSDDVSLIDTANPADPVRVRVGRHPAGVAFSPDGSRAYVTNYDDGTVSVLDVAGGVAEPGVITVGTQPAGVAVSPDGGRVYVTNLRDDTVSVIDAVRRAVDGPPIPVGTGAATADVPNAVAVSPDGTRLYVANTGSDTLSVVDVAARATVAGATVGDKPHAVAVSPDGARVLVANVGGDDVSVVAAADLVGTSARVESVRVGDAPRGVALSRDGTRAYVANFVARQTPGSVTVLDTSVPGTPTALRSIAVDRGPWAVAVSPDGAVVYVTNNGSDSVSTLATATG